MCNSSFQSNNSISLYNDVLQWNCICQAHVGGLVMTAIAALSLILGMPIYGWSLWVSLHRNMKHNFVFSLNLTVLELFYCFIYFIDLILSYIGLMPNYQLIILLVGLNWTVRPLLQICMCTEHYLAVIHPLTFLRYKGIQYRIALAAAAWLIGLGNALRLILSKTDYFPDAIFFILFCIAVIITSFCCVSVLRALKLPGPGKQKNVEMTEKDRHNKTDKGRAVENQQKRKAFRIISHILVSILISYIPQVVAYFMVIAKVNSELYICSALPTIMSITMITVLLSPLVRMYSEGHLKYIMCFFFKFREQIKSK